MLFLLVGEVKCQTVMVNRRMYEHALASQQVGSLRSAARTVMFMPFTLRLLFKFECVMSL